MQVFQIDTTKVCERWFYSIPKKNIKIFYNHSINMTCSCFDTDSSIKKKQHASMIQKYKTWIRWFLLILTRKRINKSLHYWINILLTLFEYLTLLIWFRPRKIFKSNNVSKAGTFYFNASEMDPSKSIAFPFLLLNKINSIFVK